MVSSGSTGKRCIACGVLRSADWFSRNSKHPSGLSVLCKPCAALYAALRADRLAATA